MAEPENVRTRRPKPTPPPEPTIAGAAAASEFVTLEECAAELIVQKQHLVRLARRGQFPAMMKVTQKSYRVRRVDYEAWKAGRWTTTDEVRAAMVQAIVAAEEPPNRRRKGRRA